MKKNEFTGKALGLLTIFVSLLTVGQLNGQNFGVMNAPVPPSPTASSILKSVEVPVNHYTGLPDIVVPLFHLKGKDLSLPINLTYNANGFKVDEIPGWVGYGWELSCSGTVARTIMDAPDNIGHGYASDDMDTYYNGLGDPITNDCDGVTAIGSAQFAKYTLLFGSAPNSNNFFDTEPDIYSFRIPDGPGGRFVVDRNNTIRLMPKSSLKISMSLGSNLDDLNFQIHSGEGTLYTFQTFDRIQSTTWSTNYLMNGVGRWGSIYPKNAWYLDGIHSAKSRESILFSYVAETTVYKSPLMQSKGFLVHPTYPDDEVGINYDNTDYSSYSNIIVTGQRLSSISLNGYSVQFIAENQSRLDLEGGHRLKQIVVTYQGDTIKNFKFYHSYFYESSAEGYLRLDSLVEIGRNGSHMPAHKFSYNSHSSQPHKSSFAKDHWGYFNGAYNTTLLPTYFVPKVSYHPSLTYSVDYRGANRDPNAEFSQFGMLNSITYPTGGSSNFEYEANSYSRFGLEYEKIKRLGTVLINGSSSGNTIGPNGRFINFVDFTLPDTTYVFVDALEICEDTSGQGGIFADCGIIILGLNTLYSQALLVDKTFFKIPPGNFRLQAELGTNRVSDVIGATIRWYDKGNQLHTKQGPGLRIKSIKFYDPVKQDTVLSKHYEYKLENGISSGLLHDLLRYDYDYRATNNGQTNEAVIQPGFPGIPSCENNLPYILRVLESKSLNSFTQQGTMVGYDRVIEKLVKRDSNGSVSNNGYSVFEFYNEFTVNDMERAINPSAGSPNALINSETGLSGKPLRNQIFDTSNRLVFKTENTYHLTSTTKVVGFQVQPTYKENCGYCLFSFGVYQHNSLGVELASSISTTYHYGSSGFTSLQTQTTNVWEFRTTPGRDSYLILKDIQTTNSDGSTETTHYRYPFDFSGQPSATQSLLNSLTNSNRLIPILKLNSNSRVGVTNGILLDYELDMNGGLFPARVKSQYEILTSSSIGLSMALAISDLKNPPPLYKKRLAYKYDAAGNILSIQKETGENSVFLWSDEPDSKLIAEVSGVHENEVYFENFETSGTMDTSARTGLKSRLSNFMFSPPGNLQWGPSSMLSYWYWDGSSWNYKEVPFLGNPVNIQDGFKIDDLKVSPQGALMTTYTYRSGIGASSATDANNRTMYYEYDDFNRLRYVKDDKRNIIKEYFYNVTNQQ
jgi:hypothetical protein